MKINVEKAIQISGNSNKYQYLLFIAVVLTWFAIDFVAITFPLLELSPNFLCRDNINSNWVQCTEKEACSKNEEDRSYTSEYKNVVIEFDLLCERGLTMLIGVIYISGIIVGALLSSKFSDIYGRKPILLSCHGLFTLATAGLIVSPNIWCVFISIFLIGISSACGTMVSYLYISEVLAPNRRAIYGSLINGGLALAGIAYFTAFYYLKHWRYLAIISFFVTILSGLMILFCFTESPRYHVSKGEIDRGIKALYYIAYRNGKEKELNKYFNEEINKFNNENSTKINSTIKKESSSEINDNLQLNKVNSTFSNISMDDPTINKEVNTENYSLEEIINKYKNGNNFKENLSEPLLPENNNENNEDKIEKKKNLGSYLSLFKYKSLRTNFLVCNLLWFVGCFTYYGISFVLKRSGEDVFLDGYVVYGSESISYFITGLLISVAFIGRVRCLLIMFLLTSLSTSAYYFVEVYKIYFLNKALLSMARFCVTAVYCITYTYSTEIYPTVVRAKGFGINVLCARFGAILVPIIVELFNPFLIFGVLCLIAFFCTFLIPETFGKELEEEIEEEKINIT